MGTKPENLFKDFPNEAAPVLASKGKKSKLRGVEEYEKDIQLQYDRLEALKEQVKECVLCENDQELKKRAQVFLEEKKKEILEFNKLSNILVELDQLKVEDVEAYNKDENGRRLIRKCNDVLNQVDNIKFSLTQITKESDPQKVVQISQSLL